MALCYKFINKYCYEATDAENEGCAAFTVSLCKYVLCQRVSAAVARNTLSSEYSVCVNGVEET